MIAWAKDLETSEGLILAFGFLLAGFFATFIFPKAPFVAYATGITGVFASFATQRYYKNKLDKVETKNNSG